MKEEGMVRLFILALVCLALSPAAALAQKTPPAVPVTRVETQTLGGSAVSALTVIELFTSQACVFCPQADAVLEELAGQDNVIALSCHIDSFRLKEDALAQEFCTRRQNAYEKRLHSGPKYTPQMVINGRQDIIGHKRAAVWDALQKRRRNKIAQIGIKNTPAAEKFFLFLPALPQKDYEVLAVLFDKSRRIEITAGGNKGKTVTYTNVVRSLESLGSWDGAEKKLVLETALEEENAGFAVLVQNQKTGHIVAAGRPRP